MENNPSLFAAAALEAPVDLALALALPASAGHFDELHGRTLDKAPPAVGQMQGQYQSQTSQPSQMLQLAGSAAAPAPAPGPGPTAGPAASLAPDWSRFFNFLGGDGFEDLNHRTANLQRQIRDNGVTYNVYADANGPQRPWSLDLFPLILSAQDWAQIAAGVHQRARLLEHIMADVYGPQQLLAQGLLPAALVQGHPGYLRAMHGVRPAGGTFLHIAAFDLARGPDGRWWVVSQRTQAPSGLGYLLENRLAISRLFPEAFRELKVQRLAASYKALVDGMKAASPARARGEESRIVLLTPGPYNETYFEHAYLARYLGLTLVEGSDLLVRDDKLYLKTLQGLEPVHGLLKRLDDEFLDPLELRSDSTLGVPGLLQAIRAGNVLVANAPGSAFLESSALLGFLPALSSHLLDEPLALPSLATWWCGEQAALQAVLPRLKECVIKGTYPESGIESVIGQTLSRRELDEWAGRLVRRNEDYTVQAYLPLSQTPTWQGQRIAPRSTMLRVFAVADGAGSWQVLPGGLARLAGPNDKIASMQQGGSSADVWAPGESGRGAPQATAPATAEPGTPPRSATPVRHKPPVTSRAAENLFWLGRYTERTENAIRMAQLTLQSLNGEDQSSQPLLAWLSELAVKNGLVMDSVPPATQSRRVFERSLIASLADTERAASVGYNLRALKGAASAVRERLSQEQWHVIMRTEADFSSRCSAFSGPDHPASQTLEYSSVEALAALESASGFLAAMTGAQTDRMSRDDGWRLLSTGRHIERLNTLASSLILGFETGAVFDEGGFGAILALFDSTITFHAQYQQQRDVSALLDLLVLDRDNPRSLGWVTQTLRGRLARLAENTAGAPQPAPDLTPTLPDPGSWLLRDLCNPTSGAQDSGPYAGLLAQLELCCSAAFELSDTLSRRYFSHVAPDEHSLGA
ncbi:circularly permuted type 2 ATP-grasp protein [Polaromonas sp.]|uniref:circularly permuted type 2 ATP-grasp protein n=1 Tax=Polaromonas sp. TaxID=1869339 RepID=UPI002487195C|nr:circularly permuted type 2 ATP-grasp protein [Polaromonas sp.]MDI1274563.1 circularly permuted type 2 ATP-grasp protein [Polaromonas sp.]